MKILGISCFYHDAAAALVIDGDVVAAAQEERFTRKKHDERFPIEAIAYCLGEGGVSVADLDYVVFYDKPLLKFERLFETYLQYAPRGLASFTKAMTAWLTEKLWIPTVISRQLGYSGQILFAHHHQAHAASAFFPSPFRDAAILTVDGVGEWATTSWAVGEGNRITMKEEIDFPHSIGLLYSAFTYYLGFKVNSGEYKVMGLAPYGKPRYADIIREKLVVVAEDGAFRLNLDYFEYPYGLRMTNERFDALFGAPPRTPESPLTQRDMDIAASIQLVTEELMLGIARYVRRESGKSNLCLAGGVALNCVANRKIADEKIFDRVWIQPAAGDAGGALGAALSVWYEYLGNERRVDGRSDLMKGALLGPSFTDTQVRSALGARSAVYETLDDELLYMRVAELLSQGAVVGWFQGRMEFGPRALGSRSILGDPRDRTMQSRMNLKIKYRESFRPFAPSVKEERADAYFVTNGDPSPYMLFTAPVAMSQRVALKNDEASLVGIERLRAGRSSIPAVTHVDFSARLQTVNREVSPRYWSLLDAFEKRTGCAVLVNTSFNVRGEPIVCTPDDAYRCFMGTDMDFLVIENHLLDKKKQPAGSWGEEWRSNYQPD
jgi:carbamoyltransferase